MKPKFGPTGTYPHGKLNPTDEGALTIGIAADHENQTVIINFGKRVAWLGFPKDQALQLAALITKRASELD